MKCCSDSAAFSSPFAACSRPSSNRKSARACSSPPAFSSSLESATKRAWLPSWSQPVDALKSAIFAHGEGERAICSKSAEALLKRLARYCAWADKKSIWVSKDGAGRNDRASSKIAIASSKCLSSISNCANSSKAGEIVCDFRRLELHLRFRDTEYCRNERGVSCSFWSFQKTLKNADRSFRSPLDELQSAPQHAAFSSFGDRRGLHLFEKTTRAGNIAC